MIDRSEVSRALAKAIAHKNAGNDDQAAQWARELVTLLECAEILSVNACPFGEADCTDASHAVLAGLR